MALETVLYHSTDVMTSTSDREMASEFFRIGSFSELPSDLAASPLALARAGFYSPREYKGSAMVKCFSCGVQTNISDWASSDVPVGVHRQLSPHCSLISSAGDCGNVPIANPEGNLCLQNALAFLRGGVCAITEGQEAVERDRDEGMDEDDHQVASSPATADTARDAGFDDLDSATSYTNENEHVDIVQAAIDKVPASHKIPPTSYTTQSTDPRKLGKLAFMDLMRSEKERRSTFYDWPQGAWQHPTALAAAGFFYTGSADRVQCAFCRITLRNWEPNDVPKNEHRIFSAECPFVRGRNVGNIPLPSTNQREGRTPDQSQTSTQHSPAAPLSGGVGLGIMTQQPKNPDFAIEATRVATFEHPCWPVSTRQSHTQLAKAGFYYTGFSDNVKCFFCDGGLRNWEPEDVPLEEHEKWFPRCAFVKMVKENTLIRETQQYTNLSTSQAQSRTEIQGREYTAATAEAFPNAESLHEAIHAVTETLTNDAANVTKTQGSTKKRKGEKKQKKEQDVKSGVIGENGKQTQDSSNKEEYQRLVEENEAMKGQRSCKICMDDDVNVLFLPCSHLVCCANCAPALRKCPICRKVIKGTVRIFMTKIPPTGTSVRVAGGGQ